MNILIACEESQVECKAFREHGHNAFSCDIQKCGGGHPERHINGDVLPILNGRCNFVTEDGEMHTIHGRWDMIIGHPPCTYLTAAGACRMYPIKGGVADFDRLIKALEATKFFYEILFADCNKVCVENPVPLKIVPLIPPTQKVQPWMWRDIAGENYTKRTCLWLRGLPPLKADCENPNERTSPYVNAGCKKANGEYRARQGIAHGAKKRSKSFIGIAKAMAEQWGNYERPETN